MILLGRLDGLCFAEHVGTVSLSRCAGTGGGVSPAQAPVPVLRHGNQARGRPVVPQWLPF